MSQLPRLRPLHRAAVLGLGHASVDSYAAMIGPLMLVFVAMDLFSEANAKLLPAVSVAATSLAQPLTGLLSDKGLPKAVSLAGPAFAACGFCLAMVSGSPAWVIIWLLIGGVGVAVYHPEAAVMSSAGAGSRAAMATSIFLFGGTIGLWLGPAACGWLVDHLSVPASAALLVVPGLVIGLGLASWTSARSATSDHELQARPAAPEPRTNPADRGARLNASLMLLTTLAIFRALAMGAVGVIVPWWAEHRDASMTQVGLLSGLFLFAGGLGMLLMGWLSRPRWEKATLAGTALVAMLPIWLLGQAGTLWQGAICIIAGGFLVNGTNAIVVAMSQRYAPQSTRTASAMTMGFAWGVGGTVGPLLVWLAGTDETALTISALVLVPAAVCAVALPGPVRTARRTAG